MSRWPALAVSILTALAAFTPSQPAAAADTVHAYADNDSVCGHPNVLNTIKRRFRYQVTHVPHLPDVDIVDFYRVRQTRYHPATEKSPIERQYCSATVSLSDGRSRSVWYLIEYGMGFASMGDNVEFCVSGFDRWHVYDGACRVLR